MVTTWKSVILLGLVKKQIYFRTSFKGTTQMFYKCMDEVDGVRVAKSFQSRV